MWFPVVGDGRVRKTPLPDFKHDWAGRDLDYSSKKDQMTKTEHVNIALRTIRQSIEEIDTLGPQITTLNKLVPLIEDLEGIRRDISDVVDGLHKHAYDLMDDKEHEVPGIGLVIKAKSSNHKWDDDAVISRLRQTCVDSDGVIDESKFNQKILDSCHISYWRIGRLEKNGVKVDDEMREKRWGKPRVRLER